ncbi:MAG: TM0106 family RecB-like putative nuclease [Bacteroidota bacterium]|nr:TM0106 family RecB-like putative nuclease [Bacteroidota bacterium]
MEGNPDQELYYLIGVLICKDDTTICNSFWADKTSDEAHIWQQFLSIINAYPLVPIYHYGNYESKAINILGKRYNTNVVHIQNRLINIVNSIFGKIYFPVYSNRLKELGNYLGATWSSANASGIQSLVWRHQWNDTKDEKYKQILITYNLGKHSVDIYSFSSIYLTILPIFLLITFSFEKLNVNEVFMEGYFHHFC